MGLISFISSIIVIVKILKFSFCFCICTPRWCKLAARTQFKIHNSLPVPFVPLVSPVPAFSTLPPVSPVPLVPQFKIPLALFRALYRLEKHLSLWWVKRNSGAVLLYFTDRKSIEILTTHLVHYPILSISPITINLNYIFLYKKY